MVSFVMIQQQRGPLGVQSSRICKVRIKSFTYVVHLNLAVNDQSCNVRCCCCTTAPGLISGVAAALNLTMSLKITG
jgi:hypothetical protein